MMARETIGARIQRWRTRRVGMTQGVLAELAGVSQSYISQVEAGYQGVGRRVTLVAVANALRVTVADLLGQPGDPTDPPKGEAAGAVSDIWMALMEIEEGERRAPTRTREQLDAAVRQVGELRMRADYPSMAGVLPGLLVEAAAHDEPTRSLALTQIAYATSVCMRKLGYWHLTLPAAKLAVAAAQGTGRAAWIGAAEFVHTRALPVDVAALTSRVADRAVAELQAAAAAPEARQMLGLLHLSAALACAVDQRADDAQAHLAEAASEAATLGDPADGIGFNLGAFGPTNVGVWTMDVAIELGDYDRCSNSLAVAQRGLSWAPEGLGVHRFGSGPSRRT